MFRDYVENGRRCEAHIGDTHPVRCSSCDVAAQTVYAATNKFGECTQHPNYPAPCRRCQEDS